MTAATDLVKTTKDALDNSAEKNRNLFIAVNLFLATILVLVLSITDYELLILSKPLQLPLVNVGLPLMVFSITACLFVLALHFVLLYNLVEHRDKLKKWMEASTTAGLTPATTELFPSLFDFAYLRWHTHHTGRELIFFSWLAYVVLPLGVMATVLICFADLQMGLLTLVQLAFLALDAWMVYAYWGKQNFWPRWVGEGLPFGKPIHWCVRVISAFVCAYLVFYLLMFAWVQVESRVFSKSVYEDWSLPKWLVAHEPAWPKLVPRLEVQRKRVTQLNEDFFKLYQVMQEEKQTLDKGEYQKVLTDLSVAPEPDLTNRHFAFADFQRSEFQGLNLGQSNFYGAYVKGMRIDSAFRTPDLWLLVNGVALEKGVNYDEQLQKQTEENKALRQSLSEKNKSIEDAQKKAAQLEADAAKANEALEKAKADKTSTDAQVAQLQKDKEAADKSLKEANTKLEAQLASIKKANSSTPSTTPANATTVNLIAGRYQVLAGGSEIKDTQTNLIWQRCSVGQNWTGRTCEGEAKTFTYAQAKKLEGQGWRLPTVRELFSLVSCSSGQIGLDTTDVKDGGPPLKDLCRGNYSSPTINTEAFPNTNWWYWSSSAYNESRAWVVNFNYGYVLHVTRGGGLLVRLVRAGGVSD